MVAKGVLTFYNDNILIWNRNILGVWVTVTLQVTAPWLRPRPWQVLRKRECPSDQLNKQS